METRYQSAPIILHKYSRSAHLPADGAHYLALEPRQIFSGAVKAVRRVAVRVSSPANRGQRVSAHGMQQAEKEEKTKHHLTDAAPDRQFPRWAV
jgi:hypothetical protein